MAEDGPRVRPRAVVAIGIDVDAGSPQLRLHRQRPAQVVELNLVGRKEFEAGLLTDGRVVTPTILDPTNYLNEIAFLGLESV